MDNGRHRKDQGSTLKGNEGSLGTEEAEGSGWRADAKGCCCGGWRDYLRASRKAEGGF